MPVAKPSSAVDRLVFPLDVPDLDDARAGIERLAGRVGVFKVGLELFTAVGPDAVRLVHDAGARCFLDLKIHDIPATMAGVYLLLLLYFKSIGGYKIVHIGEPAAAK